MGVSVAFDKEKFALRYPEFSSVSETLLADYFTEAGLYHANDGSGPVKTAAQQLMLMNMVTAHIAARYATVNGVAAPSIVGRINSATEGSVTVQTEFKVPEGTPAFWAQTKYGVDYWIATNVYRTFRVRPGPRRSFNPPYHYGPR